MRRIFRRACSGFQNGDQPAIDDFGMVQERFGGEIRELWGQFSVSFMQECMVGAHLVVGFNSLAKMVELRVIELIELWIAFRESVLQHHDKPSRESQAISVYVMYALMSLST